MALADDLAQAQAELDSLKQALVLAQQAGQLDALPGLQAQYQYWTQRRAALYAQQTQGETPGALAQFLAGIAIDPKTGAVTPAPNWLTDLEALFEKDVVVVGVGLGLYLFGPSILRAVQSSRRKKAT